MSAAEASRGSACPLQPWGGAAPAGPMGAQGSPARDRGLSTEAQPQGAERADPPSAVGCRVGAPTSPGASFCPHSLVSWGHRPHHGWLGQWGAHTAYQVGGQPPLPDLLPHPSPLGLREEASPPGRELPACEDPHTLCAHPRPVQAQPPPHPAPPPWTPGVTQRGRAGGCEETPHSSPVAQTPYSPCKELKGFWAVCSCLLLSSQNWSCQTGHSLGRWRLEGDQPAPSPGWGSRPRSPRPLSCPGPTRRRGLPHRGLRPGTCSRGLGSDPLHPLAVHPVLCCPGAP